MVVLANISVIWSVCDGKITSNENEERLGGLPFYTVGIIYDSSPPRFEMEETTSKSTLPVLLPSFDSEVVVVLLPKGGVGFANSTDGGGGAFR